MSQLDSTKTRILMAAGPIFARKGFKATTVREICDAAKVNLASVNYYFGDKQRLYLDAVMHARQMRAERVPEPNWDLGTPPKEKLRGYIELILNRVVALKSAPWQVRLLIREILQPTDACKTLAHDYFRPFLNGLMEIVDEIVGVPLSPEKRLKIAFSIVGQCMYYRFAGDLTAMMIAADGLEDDFESASLAAHITDFSLAAIRNLSDEVVEQPTIKITETGRGQQR